MVLLWDFDNTLATRPGMWSMCLMQSMHDAGYDHVRIEDVRQLLTSGFPWHSPHIPHSIFLNGMGWWQKMEQHFEVVFSELGANKAEASVMASGIRSRYLDLRAWQLFDDTIEALEISRSKGYKNYILSNHVPELDYFVHQIGLSGYFEKVYSSANIGFEKPHEAFYKIALADAHIDPADAVMIGDNYVADIVGAQALDIRGILVHTENINAHLQYSKDLKGIFEWI